MIHVAREGSLRLRTDRADVQVAQGRPQILSLGHVMEVERSKEGWLCLFPARDTVPDLDARNDGYGHPPLQGPIVALLADNIETLRADLPRMTQAELPRAAVATRAVILTCVASSAPLGPADKAHIEQARLGPVRQLVRQNLTSTRLWLERLAQMAGMSRTGSYRPVKRFGGVARCIQRERLAQPHRSRVDPEIADDSRRVAEGALGQPGLAAAFTSCAIRRAPCATTPASMPRSPTPRVVYRDRNRFCRDRCACRPNRVALCRRPAPRLGAQLGRVAGYW